MKKYLYPLSLLYLSVMPIHAGDEIDASIARLIQAGDTISDKEYAELIENSSKEISLVSFEKLTKAMNETLSSKKYNKKNNIQ